MTDTLVDPVVGDPDTENEDPRVAHIVARLGDESADAIVMRAMVEGTPIRALCGTMFIPSRDPLRLPPCEPCLKALHEIVSLRKSL